MNVRTSQRVIVAAALFASGSALAQQAEQPVRVKVDGLPQHVAAQVKDKALQGRDDLRRFIERTRFIYELNYGALAVDDSPASIAASQGVVSLASHEGGRRT